MGVSLEAKQWTVRAGDEHEVYGDKYSGVCTVDKVGPDKVRITAAGGKFPIKDWVILRRKLNEMGYEIIFERLRNGQLVASGKESGE